MGWATVSDRRSRPKHASAAATRLVRSDRTSCRCVTDGKAHSSPWKGVALTETGEALSTSISNNVRELHAISEV
ncbi:predicted protein [Histoplasma mississippiense (nom. inval.)]|uniref:predicted protein n=1 Tax=Ajellomyces capsulatus (strain NAm1 / WU24) TaxID=2059318 RepID=UPI000157C9DA|nr:predicted protein [Histoplasma mississippiense (nom. inval.)]EDN09490.1 predicted protein [Histoplasma mississippiense (nom. inval.)]